jgi:hypothetical protein
MPFPKKIKKDISLTPYRTLYPRRVELLDKINENGTFLPKSILHADLDKGFLDFVKNDLQVISDGKIIPTVDILITTQNWSQFTQTWNFQDLDKNVSPPFITVVRNPEIKYGSHPSLIYTIPNRKEFHYASVPSFDGDRMTVNVYKIPQPVPVDITYNVKIICNRMRELNSLNKLILQKFSSRQSYTQIKGHYIPIIWNNISDDSSVMEIEKRKYYVQSYEFTLVGFLIDEEEFEVKPAVERMFQLYETVNGERPKNKIKKIENPNSFDVKYPFPQNESTYTKIFRNRVNLKLISDTNVLDFLVFINGNFYGTSNSAYNLQLNNDDVLRIDMIKHNPSEYAELLFSAEIT